MNIYQLRFVNNKTNNILEVSQLGHSKEEVENFWRDYFHDGKNVDPYTFIDAYLLVENVDGIRANISISANVPGYTD